jgi:hypothetical protein
MKVKVKSRDSGESDMHMKNMGCKEKRKVIACVCIVSGLVCLDHPPSTTLDCPVMLVAAL